MANGAKVETHAGDACLNCEVPLHGPFCHACGQKHVSGRLSTKTLFAQLLEALTESDSTVWQTLRQLIGNPGRVALRYIDGGRAQFLNPVRFLLISFTIYFSLMVLTGAQVDIANRVAVPGVDTNVDADTQAFFDYLIRVIASQMDLVIFIVIPILVLLIRWQHFWSHRNYAETFAFVCFVFGLGYLFAAPIVPLQAIFDMNSSTPKNALTAIFFFYGSKTFFNMHWVTTVFGTIVTGVLYLLTVMTVTSGVALAEIYWDQWLNPMLN